jgi:hypothetical protein
MVFKPVESPADLAPAVILQRTFPQCIALMFRFLQIADRLLEVLITSWDTSGPPCLLRLIPADP